MKGWQIFVHSVRLVMNNLNAAFRVSIVLYLVAVAVQVYQFLNPPQMVEGIPVVDPGSAFMLFILAVISLVMSLWIAVAWHRYVLSGELPEGYVPVWRGSAIGRYFWRSVVIGILVALAAVLVSVPMGFIVAGLPGLFWLVLPVAIGAGAYVFFRLGVSLPAIAMDGQMSFGEAWEATAGEAQTILVLVALVVGGSLILTLPSLMNGDPNSLISLVYGIVVNWFATIIGISTLTTLYGHFVEGRDID